MPGFEVTGYSWVMSNHPEKHLYLLTGQMETKERTFRKRQAAGGLDYFVVHYKYAQDYHVKQALPWSFQH